VEWLNHEPTATRRIGSPVGTEFGRRYVAASIHLGDCGSVSSLCRESPTLGIGFNEMTWWREQWWLILFAILTIPVVAAAVFAWWLQRRPNIDVEKGAKCWDAFIKLISAFTVIVSGAMLFGKYIDQQIDAQKETARRAVRELNLREAEFLKQKLEFDKEHHQRKRVRFDEAKTVAARLAKEEEPTDEAIRRFDELYLASLIGVEKLHGPVEAAMVRFEKKLRNKPDAPAESLYQLSLQLSTACERELKESQDELLAQYKLITDLLGGEKPSE
jgi:hypothetical protein